MAYDGINDRFNEQVHVVNASATGATTAVIAGVVVPGSLVQIEPGEVRDGLTYKWTLAGTITGTNAAHTVKLMANGAAVMTLTAAAATAVDFICEFLVRFSGGATQNIIGRLSTTAQVNVCDYVAGTTNFRPGGKYDVNIGVGHTSDSAVVHFCITEAWVK